MKTDGSKPLPMAQNAAETVAAVTDGVARRIELSRRPAPEDAQRPSNWLFFGEVAASVEPLLRQLRDPLVLPEAEHPKLVMLLPGFGTHPLRMRHMARTLEAAGHTVKRWGTGFNLGASEESFGLVSERVRELHERYGRKLVLVGWSLGGIFAREIAKLYPECVEKVVTMGSPFSHTPYSNNVWRIYELITGHPVDEPPIEIDLAAKPPVETVAFWSPRDGIVAARSACGLPGERDRERALRCTHMGFSNSEEAIRAVAEELDRD